MLACLSGTDGPFHSWFNVRNAISSSMQQVRMKGSCGNSPSNGSLRSSWGSRATRFKESRRTEICGRIRTLTSRRRLRTLHRGHQGTKQAPIRKWSHLWISSRRKSKSRVRWKSSRSHKHRRPHKKIKDPKLQLRIWPFLRRHQRTILKTTRPMKISRPRNFWRRSHRPPKSWSSSSSWPGRKYRRRRSIWRRERNSFRRVYNKKPKRLMIWWRTKIRKTPPIRW